MSITCAPTKKANLYATPQRHQNQKIGGQTFQDNCYRQGLVPWRGPTPFASGQKSQTPPVLAKSRAPRIHRRLPDQTESSLQPLNCSTLSAGNGSAGTPGQVRGLNPL